MITILKPNGDTLKTIPNDDYFTHISAGELMKYHPEYDELDGWYFKVASNTIQMRTGLKEKEEWVPRAPGIDVNRFKKHWYIAYCKTHGYACAITHSNGEVELIKTNPKNKKGGSQ
ncbi:MAG: hypothetical protein WCG04_04755 [Alphaproteobacteria bacterium]